jgi:uncharacterized protein YbbC (DUF1343 family)
MFAVLVMIACLSPGHAAGQVRPGIEVLLTDSLHLVRGRRVGILTNQTGVDRLGASDIDLLRRSGIQLTAIFSPEHGFRGNLDRENIKNTIDSATGVPIYSLFGSIRAPTAGMLSQIDVLLVDLQDIGARPYTYISTTLLAMRAAHDLDRTVIVLDRPDPIGGELVQGPLREEADSSFVGMLPVPLRHGMTLGELARLGNARLRIGARLIVVPVAGWRRSEWFEETGLPWVRPSPNMPDLESAAHYPGLVLFEATNLSVGRGTPIAFQVLAAPWLNPRAVRDALGAVPGAELSDTTIVPLSPSDGKYAGRTLPALRFLVRDRRTYDPTRLAVRLLAALRLVHRDSLVLQAQALDQRAGTARVRLGIERGVSGDSIWSSWRADIVRFVRARQDFLLYR